MALHVDDFGCVPDGRFLEQVSINADAAALTVSDGLLRAIDVGKNIAIPGAADLVATIAGLVNHLIVENASMTIGDPTRLTGTLKNPKRPDVDLPFRYDLHEGMRITVAGAGPAGSTLVSDVVEVVDATTIILADATSAAVSNVEVILNDPDLVALSNYARQDVSDLTVDLGDRSVGDARMRIGGRGLESATARFSSLDLNKQVTIQAAGLLVTTIQSVTSPTQATLTAPAQRAVENVQADVWKTDSRPGLELLLEALPSLHVESAEIVFGPGVYDFTRIPDLPGLMDAAIGLRDVSNLTLRGAGAGATILRLMPNQDLSSPDTHVIETATATTSPCEIFRSTAPISRWATPTSRCTASPSTRARRTSSSSGSGVPVGRRWYPIAGEARGTSMGSRQQGPAGLGGRLPDHPEQADRCGVPAGGRVGVGPQLPHRDVPAELRRLPGLRALWQFGTDRHHHPLQRHGARHAHHGGLDFRDQRPGPDPPGHLHQ